MIPTSVNLLPADALKAFRRQRRLMMLGRVLIALGCLAGIVGIFAGSSWKFVEIIHRAEEERRDVERRSAQLQRAENFEARLKGLAVELRALGELRKPQYDPAALLRDIVAVQPAGIRLDAMTVNLVGPAVGKSKQNSTLEGAQIWISGKGATRGDILDFQHAIERFAFAASVDGPLENILKPTDALFTFSIVLKQPPPASLE